MVAVPVRSGVVVVAIIALIVSMTSACGKSDAGPSSPTSSAAPSKSADPAEIAAGTVGGSGVRVSGQVGQIKVTIAAPAGVADPGTRLALVSTDKSGAAASMSELSSSAAVKVLLGDQLQPKKPIELTFDLSGQPGLYNLFSESVKPVIASNTDSSTNSDLLMPVWNETTKVLTATTDHLSTFQVIAVDVGSVLTSAAERIGKSADETLDSLCSNSSQVTVAGDTLTLTPSKTGVVAACLRDTGSGLAIDLTSGSMQFYHLSSRPAGQFTNAHPLPGTDQLAMLLNQAANAGSGGLLTPKGKGSLVFPAGQTSATITLDVDPAALQLETILTGLDMLGVDGDALVSAFLGTKSAYDCLFAAYQSWTTPDKPSAVEFTKSLGDVAQCGLAAAELAVGAQDKSHILHKMSVAAALFTTLPSQLVANVTGILGEFNGANHLEFDLTGTGSGSSTTSSSTPSGSPTGPGWFTFDQMDWLSSGNGSECCSTLTIVNTEFSSSVKGTYQTGPNPGDDNDHLNLLLAGKCDQLDVFIGQSAESAHATDNPGRFRIFLDDTRLVADQTISLNQEAIHVMVDLTGASRLKLQDDRHLQDPINVWGTPRIHCSSNPHPKG